MKLIYKILTTIKYICPMPYALCLREQSGRSLIETLGMLAIMGVLVAATFGIYQTVQTRMTRTIATSEMSDVARDARILFAGRPDFYGISLNHMIRMGALRSDTPPRIAHAWDFVAYQDGFFINLYGLSNSNCLWAAMQYFEFSSGVFVNDMMFGEPAGHCQDTNNKVSIFVR